MNRCVYLLPSHEYIGSTYALGQMVKGKTTFDKRGYQYADGFKVRMKTHRSKEHRNTDDVIILEEKYCTKADIEYLEQQWINDLKPSGNIRNAYGRHTSNRQAGVRRGSAKDGAT